MTTRRPNINHTVLPGKLPVCLEVKLILRNSLTSLEFANKLATGSLRTTAFYSYATYHRALNASCRRGWRSMPLHGTESRRGTSGNHKFDEFRLISPWIDTDRGVLDASEVLPKLNKMEGATLCNKNGLRLHVLSGSCKIIPKFLKVRGCDRYSCSCFS